MQTIQHAVAAVNVGMVATTSAHQSESSKKSSPEKYEGYLLKKKKWPRKGWHKRYFILMDGFLKYAKTPQSIAKNKLHGMIDVGLSVMSTKKNSSTIDLDAEDTIFHLKAKTQDSYQSWIVHLRLHREFRQSGIKKDTTLTYSNTVDSIHVSSTHVGENELMFPDQDSTFSPSNEDLKNLQQDIAALGSLLAQLQDESSLAMMSLVTTPPSPNLSKKNKKTLKKGSKKSLKMAASNTAIAYTVTDTSDSFQDQPNFKVPRPIQNTQNLSHSNPDLSIKSAHTSSTISLASDSDWNDTKISKPQLSTPTQANPRRAATFSVSSTENPSAHLHSLTTNHEKFIVTASKVHKSFYGMMENLSSKDESQRSSVVAQLRNLISQLSNENQELRSRLQRIHADSSLNEPSVPMQSGSKRKTVVNRPMLTQMLSDSQLSITETVSEMFYDAEEYLLSDAESSTDSEGSEVGDDEASSGAELSEGEENETTSAHSLPYEVEVIDPTQVKSVGRRERLPCPRPDTDVSLWNILKKNIGKDLSKVAMPVTLNEPLNALQILCEELEYTDLLEKADSCDDKFDRMMYVAAFAVSAYCSTYTRAGQKPFNPILGETYECIRDDKGFKFIAEQVSHHPPISVCHASGENFKYWQDSRFKNKFWGKSMEIFPIGSVHLRLDRFDEDYAWNKVTSCVHNIMSGTRWIEHYGDMVIRCKDVTCKVTLSKSGYWNNKSGEVTGTISDSAGNVKHRMYGKWFEGLFSDICSRSKCIWRAGAMPPDCDRYYGFSRFAIELNEIDVNEEHLLPRTDTRFRPDQRALENGDIATAEREKQRIEQLQREQKKHRDSENLKYEPLFFRKISIGEVETWEFMGEYWKLRSKPGFANFKKLPVLW